MTLFDGDKESSNVLYSRDNVTTENLTKRTRVSVPLSKIDNDHLVLKSPTRPFSYNSMESVKGMTKTMSIHRRKKVLFYMIYIYIYI